MKIVTIPFNEWSTYRIWLKKKLGTTRTQQYGDVNDIFESNGKFYQLIYVIKVPLSFVRDILYKCEGADSPEEFESVWCEIHPKKGFAEDQLVWYHHFKYAGTDLDKIKKEIKKK
jgi:hypothetical protein